MNQANLPGQKFPFALHSFETLTFLQLLATVWKSTCDHGRLITLCEPWCRCIYTSNLICDWKALQVYTCRRDNIVILIRPSRPRLYSLKSFILIQLSLILLEGIAYYGYFVFLQQLIHMRQQIASSYYKLILITAKLIIPWRQILRNFT